MCQIKGHEKIVFIFFTILSRQLCSLAVLSQKVHLLILAFDKIKTHHVDVDLADLGASVLLAEVLDALLLNGNLLDEHIAQIG